MSEVISVPKLCELYDQDPSNMRKMIAKLEIKIQRIRRASDNKLVSAIVDEDHQLLVDTYPQLTAKSASKYFVSFSEAMKELGFKKDQHTHFKKTCIQFGFEVYKKKFNKRTQSCIKISDFNKFKKIRNAIVTRDIE